VKKALRALLIAIGVSWLGAVLILGLTLSPVDYTPYYREAYWRETAELLKANVATNKTVTGELYAGFGRAVLTPSIGATTDQPDAGQFRSVPLAGYGNRKGKPATGKHDDLYIKAAALKVGDRIAVMIAADALIIPREVADLASEQLRKELRLNRDQIYFSATHSHSSIGGWGEGFVAEDFAGPFQPGVLSWFAKRLADATRDAVADLKPAEFGFATFSAGECVRNRLVGEAALPCRPMEQDFGQEAYSLQFDSFMRHYLTMRTGEIPREREIYEAFKDYARESTVKAAGITALVKEIRSYAGYFCTMALDPKHDSPLLRAFHDLRELRVDVAYPFLLTLYHDWATGTLTGEDFTRAVRLGVGRGVRLLTGPGHDRPPEHPLHAGVRGVKKRKRNGRKEAQNAQKRVLMKPG